MEYNKYKKNVDGINLMIEKIKFQTMNTTEIKCKNITKKTIYSELYRDSKNILI